MCFKVFKNTVLFLVLICISCGNKVKQEDVGSKLNEQPPNELLHQVLNDKSIIVGANRTEAYLPLLQGKRVGVLANQTSVIFRDKKRKATFLNYNHIIDSLISLNINIKKVFAPEHGFRGTADAGELVKDGKDTKTGLHINSLHGKHKKPTKAKLKNIDVMVFDIQDVGVRFYTYISTLHYVMEACAEQNIPLIILDRPNPNGNYIDGPVLEKKHSSFLGMHPIPLVHGMTLGEYAKMINGEAWLNDGVTCDITIIELENYSHESFYTLPIRPSPNLPNDQSIILYPSLGLFEGTDINAGRGTEFQFQRYGAPFLDKAYYKFNYTPVANFGAKYPKHKNKICYGTDLSKIEAERRFTLNYIMDAYNHATDKSKVFNTYNFTVHAGTEKLQKQIEAGLTETEIRATWQDDLEAYKKMRSKYLIYD
ncbi:exo-beta-N-acetylmuramidase NamZ domain-containing protein [Winogradskyella sp. R77965]|uniref:exo-beta-N-acetylmuramidase NamZ family protein n=1 Tax=Winogradskyella sp. R77965 TaxID=3093872 RepID=UPI0037DC3EAD